MNAQTSLPSVLLVGCGHMGKAILKGWLDSGLSPSVIVNRNAFSLPDPHRLVSSIEAIPQDFQPQVILLAVKPNQIESILPSLKIWTDKALFISVIGGKTLNWFGQQLGKEAAFIRAMPNTPAELQQGMTSLFANPQVTKHQKEQAEKLLKAIGQIAWLPSEADMDVATAIAGCGPAYVFLLAELLEQSGKSQGLPANIAKQLARQTVIGSAALLAKSSKESAKLREEITTPNGITERALRILMAQDAWPMNLSKALQAAIARSKELAS